jgi:pimeloyl-ACP methyl ester carboxylesterase/DNA-binding CsgD family transcriptional regulator
VQQTVRYLTTGDGVQLAWASMGAGAPLVKAANWMTHLQYDLESPVWRHWIRFFAQHFHFIRYDERGCGMTQWQVPDVSPARWADDLDAVIEASGIAEPAVVLGISQGAATAIMEAVWHPERVSQLILYGGYAAGIALRGDDVAWRRYQAIIELARLEWGNENSAFRQVFTSRFVPEARPEQLDWFNELCRRTTTGEIAAHLMLARSQVNVRDLLSQVRVPTLVIHASRDDVSPASASRELAAGIPGAEFVQLESRNHVLLEEEPAWARFRDLVLEFTGRLRARQRGEAECFTALTGREREVLGALIAGSSNAQIAAGLAISDKTVRNMLTRIFDKLGVKSRAQAIVLARDGRFDAGP